MQARSRFVVALIAFAVATAGAVANNKYMGKEFPPFKAKDAVTGKPLDLKSLRGKVVLIDFWATWCGPCVRELPNVQKTYKAYKDQGFEIVSISLDSNRGKFETFVKSRKMTWHHVMEGGGWKTRLAGKYGIRSIPAMYLLDHNGVCISDRARGPALENAVKVAVAKIPKKNVGSSSPGRPRGLGEIPEQGDPETDPELDVRDSERVLIQIKEARQALVDTGAPVMRLANRLDSVERTIDALDAGMADPSSPSSMRRRYIAMCDELTEIRREMFACGMLNEKLPALPVNPFDEPGQDTRRGLTLAWGELPKAKETVAELKIRVNVVSRRITSARSKLKSLERRLTRDPDDVTQADRAKVLVQAERVAGQCRNAWEKQLTVVERQLARHPGPEGERLRNELAALRSTLASNGFEDPAARRRFAMICGELLAMN